MILDSVSGDTTVQEPYNKQPHGSRAELNARMVTVILTIMIMAIIELLLRTKPFAKSFLYIIISILAAG